VGFRIKDFGLLGICQAGGGLAVSKSYNVLLPPSPQIGQIVDYKVSQQIAPGAADRFTTRLDVPDPARQDGMRLYQLDILLFHDTATEPVSAGTVLVSVPYLPDHSYFWRAVPPQFKASYDLPASAPVKRCLMDNEARYKRLIQLDGERSPKLNAALAVHK
jgi:hypothetical protein